TCGSRKLRRLYRPDREHRRGGHSMAFGAANFTYRGDPTYKPIIEGRLKSIAFALGLELKVNWRDGGPHTAMQTMEASVSGDSVNVAQAKEAIEATLRECDKLPGQGIKGRIGEWVATRLLGMKPPK